MIEDIEKKENKRVTTILDFFLILAKRKRFIIGSTLIATILIIVFSILAMNLPYYHEWNYFPNLYGPVVKVMITWEEMAGVQLIGNAFSTYSSFGSSMVALGINPFLEVITQLLMGNTVLDSVATELNLYERLNLEKYGARGWLLQRIVIYPVTMTPLPNFYMVAISFQHSNNEEATEILNAFINNLQNKFRDLAMEQIIIRKNYIMGRMAIVENAINSYKDQLLEFQENYGVFDINKQADYQSNLITENSIEIMRKELEIELLKQYLNDNNPKIRILEDEIRTRKSFIEDLTSESISGFVSLDTLTDIKTTYSILEQNLNIQKSIYGDLVKENELIKMEESGALRNFLVIEDAEVLPYAFAPIREFHFIIVIFSVLIISIMLACIKEYFTQLIKQPGEVEKYKTIKSYFKTQKGKNDY